jgi:glutamate-1-semialdehyde aminotransferase
MIDRGVFPFPVATKQYSISAAHTGEMIAETLSLLAECLPESIPCSTLR